MGRRLSSTVHVFDPEQGDYVVYGPNDDVPANHAKLIGDHAWASDSDADDAGSGGSDSAPPRAGRGSGRDAWAAFADGKVDVDDDDSRDDIVGKLEAAGVIDREQ